MSLWADPIFDAYVAGAWQLYWTDDTLYWIAKPELRYDDSRRLHNAAGAAFISDCCDIHFWHGTIVPSEWIENKSSLTPATALTWRNIEQRRAACEILGWHRILADLSAITIDHSADPQVGDLIEVDLPQIGRERFLRVLCGTGREFALPVPPNMRTAIEAQAWTWGLNPTDFAKPEVRT